MRVNEHELRYWREKRVMTKREVALASGIAASTYYALEAGTQVRARPRTIRKIAATFGIDAEKLVLVAYPRDAIPATPNGHANGHSGGGLVKAAL